MELMNEGLRGLGHMTGPVFSAEHFQYKEVCLNVRSLKKKTQQQQQSQSKKNQLSLLTENKADGLTYNVLILKTKKAGSKKSF